MKFTFSNKLKECDGFSREKQKHKVNGGPN